MDTLVEPTGYGIDEAATTYYTYADPPTFLYHATGDKLYGKQKQIARALTKERRVAVKGCNASGKDYLTGRLVLWWQQYYNDAITVVIGPTDRQVKKVVWEHTRTAYNRANANGVNLGGRMLETAEWKIADNHFAIGFSTDDPNNIQGFHSPNLLVIVTEAHQVPDTHIDAAFRLMPRCLVMTGNPFSISGTFFEAFHSQADRWATYTISAFDTPNVRARESRVPGLITIEDVEDRRAEVGEDSPLYVAGVLGEFPESLEDVMVPLAWSKEAVGRQLPPAPPEVMAVDVARYGENHSVIARRRGPVARITWRARGKSMTELAGRIGLECEQAEGGGTLVIDGVGPGGGVIDILRERWGNAVHGWRIVEFQGGSTQGVDKRHYANKIAQAWGRMRDAFRMGEIDLDIGPGVDRRVLDALMGQMAARPFVYQSDQRIKMASKEEMRKRGQRSPDEADALAMTYAPEVGGSGAVGSLLGDAERSRWADSTSPNLVEGLAGDSDMLGPAGSSRWRTGD